MRKRKEETALEGGSLLAKVGGSQLRALHYISSNYIVSLRKLWSATKTLLLLFLPCVLQRKFLHFSLTVHI